MCLFWRLDPPQRFSTNILTYQKKKSSRNFFLLRTLPSCNKLSQFFSPRLQERTVHHAIYFIILASFNVLSHFTDDILKISMKKNKKKRKYTRNISKRIIYMIEVIVNTWMILNSIQKSCNFSSFLRRKIIISRKKDKSFSIIRIIPLPDPRKIFIYPRINLKFQF